MSDGEAARTIPSRQSSYLANLLTVLRKKILPVPAAPEIVRKSFWNLDVILSVYLDVDDVTSD